MRVPVDMPDEVWGRLASLADTKEVRVADLIAAAIKGLIDDVKPNRQAPKVVLPKRKFRPRPDRLKVTPEVLAQVIAAHDAGEPWRTAAPRFGVSESAVYQTLRRQKEARA